MTSLSKLVHVAWTFKGPEFLVRARQQWPKKFHFSAGWYHDFPTAIIAGASLFEEATRSYNYLSLRKVGNRYSLMAVGAGLAWHSLSVCLLARRVPRYHFRTLSKAQLAQIIAIAASEEVIWRAGDGTVSLLVESAGFGLTHLKIGSLPGIVHMSIFALISRCFERRYGLVASILFHSAYNIAHESESHRGKN